MRKNADFQIERSNDRKKLADAAQPLYTSLDEQQKGRFAEILFGSDGGRDTYWMERTSARRLAPVRTPYPAEDDVPEPGLSAYPRAEAVSLEPLSREQGLTITNERHTRSTYWTKAVRCKKNFSNVAGEGRSWP
jgi:hypothetical protein